jgi:hypothetical protein
MKEVVVAAVSKRGQCVRRGSMEIALQHCQTEDGPLVISS